MLLSSRLYNLHDNLEPDPSAESVVDPKEYLNLDDRPFVELDRLSYQSSNQSLCTELLQVPQDQP